MSDLEISYLTCIVFFSCRINKKEEDSQGIEHLVENEVDYVRNPLNEEEEAVGFGSTPQSVSPKTAGPGVNFRKIQETLLNQIHAKKLKEHEQRVKDYAMYNDENYEDDKEELEEIIEDEDELSSDDAEDEDEVEEEEEDLEDLLNGSAEKKKKKREKSVFVDDEAEDEDDNDGEDDDDVDDDSSDDDAGDSDSIEDEKKAGTERKDLGNTVDLTNAGVTTPIKSLDSDSKINMDFRADFTPKATNVVLNQIVSIV